MNKELFLENVKKYCAINDVKPTVACVKSGAGRNLLNQLANNGTIPSIERVQLLAQYLGCTVSDLLGEEPAKIAQAADPKADGLCQEFARLFTSLSPENQNKVIAEMLKRQREQ